MPISDDDLAGLLALVDRGRQAWIDGTPGHGVEQDDDMTIFGPFGGEPGSGTGLHGRQQQAMRLFHGGTGRCEVVKTIVSDNLVVLVLIERNDVVVEGSDESQPRVLRTTQVFEKRPGGWVRLHRHADPLVSRRSPAETFELARG